MKAVLRTLVSLVLVILLASPAMAQRPKREKGKGGGMRDLGIGMILLNESAQEELSLSEQQIEKVKEVVKKVQAKHQSERARLQDLSQAERRDKMAELAKTVNEEIVKDLGDTLKPEQVKRLKEIELQQRGPQAFMDADVIAALKLDDAQKDKIKSVVSDYTAERRGLRPMGGGGGGNFEQIRQKMAKMSKEYMSKISQILSEEQKKTWHDMTGKQFELRMNRPNI
jgi:hypothetical protein